MQWFRLGGVEEHWSRAVRAESVVGVEEHSKKLFLKGLLLKVYNNSVSNDNAKTTM